MSLTQKQQRFVDEYMIDSNATQAAIRAGYSRKTANRIATENLSKPVIAAAIRARAEAIENEKIADAVEIQQKLTDIIRQVTEEETVVVEAIGDGYTEAKIMKKKASVKDAVAAANLLAKMKGLLTEKVSLGVAPIVISGGECLED